MANNCRNCECLERDNERLRKQVTDLERRIRIAHRMANYGLWKLDHIHDAAHERIDRTGVPPLRWQRATGWDQAAHVGLQHLGNVKTALEVG